MTRSAREVSAALRAKGMESHEGRHHTMYRMTIDGVTTLVTRMSRSTTTIGDGLGKLMANQCCLQLREFWNLVDCSLSADDWQGLVSERCADGRNPFLGA